MKQFWQKWWFWLIAAAVVVSLPFSIKYAFFEPATPTEATAPSQPPAPSTATQPPQTQPPSASQPPDTDPPETAPSETVPPETTSPETRPPETKPPETQPKETKSPETEPPKTEPPATQPPATEPTGITYVLNKNTKKFHLPNCSSVPDILPKNREDTTRSRDELLAAGYEPCKRCKP